MGEYTWYKEISDDQRIRYAVTPKSGALLRAKMLAGQISALAEIMTTLGDEEGLHFETFVAEIGTRDDGTVVFDLVVLPLIDSDEDATPTA